MTNNTNIISLRQIQLFRLFARHHYIGWAEVAKFDQRTLSSLYDRGLVDCNSQGFKITDAGVEVAQAMKAQPQYRKGVDRPLFKRARAWRNGVRGGGGRRGGGRAAQTSYA